jgi:hypothetical protein
MVCRNRNGKQGTVKKLAVLYASRESKATENRKVISNELKPELSSAYHRKAEEEDILRLSSRNTRKSIKI